MWMADVEIIVEASLGDSLAKLGLAKEAVDELGNSSGTTSGKVSKFNRSMDDATIASARAGETILKTDHLIHDAESTINDVAGAIDGSGGKGGGGRGLVNALNFMNNGWQESIPLIGGFLPSLTAIPALATAAVIGVIALADAIGTLVAIVGDFIAPIGLVVGLLGGLAAAFVVGATKAAGGKGPFKEFGDTISHLGDMFQHTATILGELFLP